MCSLRCASHAERHLATRWAQAFARPGSHLDRCVLCSAVHRTGVWCTEGHTEVCAVQRSAQLTRLHRKPSHLTSSALCSAVHRTGMELVEPEVVWALRCASHTKGHLATRWAQACELRARLSWISGGLGAFLQRAPVKPSGGVFQVPGAVWTGGHPRHPRVC